MKKELHQHKPRPQRKLPDNDKIAPDEVGMVVDIDEYTIPFDSVSSVSDSTRALTYTTNENAGRLSASMRSSYMCHRLDLYVCLSPQLQLPTTVHL